MPITELQGGEAPDAILRAAFAASHGSVEDDVPSDNAPNNDDITDEVDDTDSPDDDVDNDDSAEEELENDDEEVEESDEDDEFEFEEDDEESEEEDDEEDVDTEEESYDSGYTYFDKDLNKKVFLTFEDPETGEGSTYLNRKEAERGMGRQLAYIGELKQQLDEAKERYDQDVMTLKKDLQIYEMTAKPDQLRASLILDKMPEKFRGVDPKKLGESEYDEYREARIEAEVSVDREIRQAQDAAEKQANDNKKAEQDAQEHVKNRINDATFFGFTNAEDKYMFAKRLKETPEGGKHTYNDMAISIAKAFGKGVADTFLKAVTQDIISVEDSKTETPSNKEVESDSKPVVKKKKAEQLKKKVKKKRVSSSSKGNSTPPQANARDIINAAFAANKPRPRRK